MQEVSISKYTLIYKSTEQIFDFVLYFFEHSDILLPVRTEVRL